MVAGKQNAQGCLVVACSEELCDGSGQSAICLPFAIVRHLDTTGMMNNNQEICKYYATFELRLANSITNGHESQSLSSG